MLLMGNMTKDLNHASEGANRRCDLLKENFDVTLRDAKLYTFHMNHIHTLGSNDTRINRGWAHGFGGFRMGKKPFFKARPFILSQAFPCCNYDGDFLTSNETLIAVLKHALILSSETPELHKKVASTRLHCRFLSIL
nr:peptidase C50, separase [Tanacetum cinerariifolium]